MAKFFTLSPANVPENPVLFPSMRPTFIEQGHSFVDIIEDCDVVLLDLHTRIAGYKQEDVDYVLANEKPLCSWDEFDKGGMSNLDWPHPLTKQQELILDHLDWGELKSAHFCRLLTKRNKYPQNVFPYEKAILHQEPICSPEELFNRPYDCIFIANSAPSREAIGKALMNYKKLKCHVSLGAEKIPFNIFVDWHKRGKMFVSSGAGGYSNERPQNLFSIAAMIQEENDQLLLNPFTHLQNCLKINQPPTKNNLDTIFEIVNDKERLYEIYKNNYEFMTTYYTEQYFSNYYLDTMRKNNII